MKRIIVLAIGILVLAGNIAAQDIIVTRKAEKIEAKILEVSKQAIKYKEKDNLDGPTFVLETADINSIIYANGEVQLFEAEKLTTNEESIVASQAQMGVKEDVKTIEEKMNENDLTQSKDKRWKVLVFIHIDKEVRISRFSKIYIMPFDYSEVKFPSKSDNCYIPLVEGLKNFPYIIEEELKKEYPQKDFIVCENEPSSLEDNSLCLKLKVEEFDMGSRALRVWVGFGAGAQRIRISGKAYSNTGEAFFNFEHQRMDGSWHKYEKMLNDEFHNFGEDITNIFKIMEKGK